jgi:hypothetical protein
MKNGAGPLPAPCLFVERPVCSDAGGPVAGSAADLFHLRKRPRQARG